LGLALGGGGAAAIGGSGAAAAAGAAALTAVAVVGTAILVGEVIATIADHTNVLTTEDIAPIPTWHRKDDTSGEAGNGESCPVPRERLHSDEDLDDDSLDYWRGKSTDETIDSLEPGEEEALRVRPDGTIINGNHRAKVLEERGIDINSLPAEVIPKAPLE
jgi:hypothetical protein